MYKPGMFERPIDDRLLQLLEVPRRDGLGVRQRDGEHVRYADLVRVDERIRRNNWARRKVDTLTHHMFSKQTFFFLQ